MEDEPSFSRLIEYTLSSAGYEVVTATRGDDALRKLASESPQLVLLDVMLPDLSGIEVCKQLRAGSVTPTLPVIMFSSLVDVRDKVRGLEAGGDEYVEKPADPDELLARVDAALERARVAHKAARTSGTHGTILVVDDEPGLLRLTAYTLEVEGYSIVTAESGAEALDRIRTARPLLVLLDVKLPDMSGLDVCRRIRSDPDTFDLPVIMFSALGQVADRVLGLQAGADEYISKPVDSDELLARVDALLRRSQSGSDQDSIDSA